MVDKPTNNKQPNRTPETSTNITNIQVKAQFASVSGTANHSARWANQEALSAVLLGSVI